MDYHPLNPLFSPSQIGAVEDEHGETNLGMRILSARDEEFLQRYGEEKLRLRAKASTVANVLEFRSQDLPADLIEELAKAVVKAIPDTECYIDPNDEWVYTGNMVYRNRKTGERRHYP